MRTLLLLPLLVSIAIPAYRCLGRQWAALKLRSAGYEYRADIRSFQGGTPSARPIPNKLQEVSWFPEVERLGLERANCDRTQLHYLRHLRSLTYLSLGNSQLQDSDLVHVSRLTAIKELNLSNSVVRGPGLAALSQLNALRRLSLAYCPVDDVGLSYFPALLSLEELRLDKTQITGSGVAHLQRLPRLKRLYLSESQFSDAYVDDLAGIKSLEYCDLSFSQLTLKGCVRLKKLRPDLKGSVAYLPKFGLWNCGAEPPGPICCGDELVEPLDEGPLESPDTAGDLLNLK